MNWESIEGHWPELKSKVKEQWSKLSDEDIERIAGNRDQLVGKISAKYGIGKEEVEKQLNTWMSKQQDLD